MIPDQVVIFVILAGTIILFVWGRWRHDMVAMASLLACVFTGLVPVKGRDTLAALVLAIAIGAAAFGLLPAAVAFATGVLSFLVLRIVPPRMVYEAIDWPIIILLGALFPVAGAMASTGAADLLAKGLLKNIA